MEVPVKHYERDIMKNTNIPALARNKHKTVEERLVGYDLNSRFEQAPGIKDVEKITRFIQDMKCKK